MDIKRSCNTAFVQMWRLSVVHLLRKLSKKQHERLLVDVQCCRPVTLLKGSGNLSPPLSALCSGKTTQLHSHSLSFTYTIADQKVASTLTNPDVVDYRAMWEYY